MKVISCHDGKLLTLDESEPSCQSAVTFRTGLSALDMLAPAGAFARGAVHELLSEPGNASPMFVASVLARHAWNGQERAVIWVDSNNELYPPALAALGIPLDGLFLLRPGSESEQVWAVTECLRCRGVAAVVAALPERQRFSRVQARRLQLAAERGGGVGLLLRVAGKNSAEHAAITRWLVQPAAGERNVQRWRIQLIFGHGGQVGKTVILEHHRETNRLRAAAELADRPAVPPAARATA